MSSAKGSWKAMHSRCKYESQYCFDRYGGRGITVCDRWSNFDAFLEDMGEPPTDSHTIDRIDNDGPYSTENCRWATMQEQSLNKSNNRIVSAFGKEHSLTEWCREYGIEVTTVHRRLANGWGAERAISTPPSRGNNSNYKYFSFRGEMLTLSAIARLVGMNYHTLRARIKRKGMSLEEAINAH